jgi:formylglycine-generating enzyme required for sulfatase activity
MPTTERRLDFRAPRRRFWLAAAIILATIVGDLGMTEATGITQLTASVIRLVTGEGTLVIKVDDPQVGIAIDGEDLVIAGAGPREVRLKPGQYQVQAKKGGHIVKQELVTIHRGGRQVLKVDLEPSTTPTAPDRPKVDWYLPPGAPPPATAPFDAKKAKELQEAWSKYLGVPVETTNSLGMKFVLIPPGEFLMGSTAEEQARFMEEAVAIHDTWAVHRIPFEAPQHRVRITKPFALSRYEVTRGQFRQFVEETGYKTDAERGSKGAYAFADGKLVRDPRFVWSAHPGFSQTDDHPVVNVSWNDAAAFCQWLSKKEDAAHVLPTEAQWEYGCRAGTTTFWHGGDSGTTLGEWAWIGDNSGGRTHPVA